MNERKDFLRVGGNNLESCLKVAKNWKRNQVGHYSRSKGKRRRILLGKKRIWAEEKD